MKIEPYKRKILKEQDEDEIEDEIEDGEEMDFEEFMDMIISSSTKINNDASKLEKSATEAIKSHLYTIKKEGGDIQKEKKFLHNLVKEFLAKSSESPGDVSLAEHAILKGIEQAI